MNNYKFLILVLMLFSSCESKPNDNNKEEEKDNISQVLAIHPDGKVRLEVKGDTAYSYYETGELETKSGFINGKREGMSYIFSLSGNIESIATYKDGMINGELIFFYENGNKSVEGTYKNNKQDGDKYYFYENGVIESKEHAEMGVLKGWQYEYHKNSKLKRKRHINDLEKMDEEFIYDSLGKLENHYKYPAAN